MIATQTQTAPTDPIERLREADAAMLRASFAWIDANDLWRDVMSVSPLCNQVGLRWPAFVRVFSGRVVKAEGDCYSASVDGFQVYAHKPSERKVTEVVEVML